MFFKPRLNFPGRNLLSGGSSASPAASEQLVVASAACFEIASTQFPSIGASRSNSEKFQVRSTTRKSKKTTTTVMAATLELRLSSLDAMRVPRGHCLSCDWCPRFLSPSKRILCDYCGCPPAKHHRVDNDNDDPNKKNKKMRLAAKVASSSGTPSSEDEDEEVGPESI